MLSKSHIDTAQRRFDRVLPIRAGAGVVQVTIGFRLGIPAHRDRQARQPGGDAFRRLAMQPLPFAARRAKIKAVSDIAPAAPQRRRRRRIDRAIGNDDAVHLARPFRRYEAGGDIGHDHFRVAFERIAEAATAAAPQPDQLAELGAGDGALADIVRPN